MSPSNLHYSPAEPVGDVASGESADHASDGEDGDGHGPDEVQRGGRDLLLVPAQPHRRNEVLDYLTTNRHTTTS